MDEIKATNNYMPNTLRQIEEEVLKSTQIVEFLLLPFYLKAYKNAPIKTR